MICKSDLQYLKVKLESQKMCVDMDAQKAMAENDEKMYYILDMLRLELHTCTARVQDALDLLDERKKVNRNGV